MAVLGYILLGVALLPYIAVPVLIWLTQRFSAAFNLRYLQESFLPKEVFEEYRGFSASLLQSDFSHCFDVFTRDEFLGLRFYHRVLMSTLLRTWGIYTVICNDEGELQKSYVEFKTAFPQNASFSTHNSDLIGAPIKMKTRKTLALPTQTAPGVLLDIHLRHLRKICEMEAIVPKIDNAEQTFKQFLSQDHEDQLALGAIYYDDQEKTYRPTWAGAILLGWYSMWPLTFLRRMYASLKVKVLTRTMPSIN